MAPRNQEVFTDLNGNSDGDDAALGGTEAERLEAQLVGMSQEPAGAATIKDEDLQISDDEEAEAGAAGADSTPGDEEEEEIDPAGGADEILSDFDPKDVQLLLKDAEMIDMRANQIKENKARAEADITAATAAMETAQEAGDTKANIAATQKYTAATIALQTATNDGTAVAAQQASIKTQAQALLAKAPKDAQGQPILDGTSPARRAASVKQEQAQRGSKLLPKFKSANTWFGNAKYAKQTARLIQLDKGLAAEGGVSKDDPKYFQVLGERFNREFPGLYKTTDGKPIATGQRQRGSGTPIPGQGGGGNGGAAVPASKVKLVQADLGLMAKFGMDPQNMEHRRSYLAEKRAMAGTA